MGTALASPRARPPARRADERHRPEDTTLYRVVAEELETFLIQVEAQTGSGLAQFVKPDFDTFGTCFRTHSR